MIQGAGTWSNLYLKKKNMKTISTKYLYNIFMWIYDISRAIQALHRQTKSPRDRSQGGNYMRNKSQFVCFSMQA